MVANPASTTANLFYSFEPKGGIRACYHLEVDPINTEKEKKAVRDVKSVVIENIRGKEDSVSLDTAGFQFYKHTSKLTTFDDDEEIRRVYFPESIELIKKLTGASRVEIFDHAKRSSSPIVVGSLDLRRPAAIVHIDRTAASVVDVVHQHLPTEASKLLEGRFQMINLWRPITNPAIDWPLALCDYRSLDFKKDTFPASLIFPASEAETVLMKYNENHKWKYFHGMTPDEIILIKCADSMPDGSVSPHTGFSDPTTPEGTPPRQSIELRTLVFYD